jgi:SNF2 family DNA or RNA helicase
MGLGKTAQAIAACHALWHTGGVRRGLIIVPAALKPQWLREWQLFTDAPAAVVEGTPGQRRAAFEACRRGFLLANYEQLIRDVDIVREWRPDIVVLDEAQRIKNWATRTALTVKRLDPPYRLVLTGTPMENRLDELASIVEWVDDLALEPKWRLAAWHTTPVDGKTEIGPRLAAWRTQRPVLRAVPGWRSSSCPDQENAF